MGRKVVSIIPYYVNAMRPFSACDPRMRRGKQAQAGRGFAADLLGAIMSPWTRRRRDAFSSPFFLLASLLSPASLLSAVLLSFSERLRGRLFLLPFPFPFCPCLLSLLWVFALLSLFLLFYNTIIYTYIQDISKQDYYIYYYRRFPAFNFQSRKRKKDI